MMQVFSEISSTSLSRQSLNKKFTEMCTKKAEDEETDQQILNMEPIITSRPR